ncbi:hypothetical protein ACY0I0_16070 [Clostridium perfringens]
MKTLEHDEKINKDYILKYLNISKQNSYRILRIINNVLDTTVFSFTIMSKNFFYKYLNK